jgi:hypothetical protein
MGCAPYSSDLGKGNLVKGPGVGKTVQIINPKHPKFGKEGWVQRVEKGKVYVRLLAWPNEVICTNWTSIREIKKT